MTPPPGDPPRLADRPPDQDDIGVAAYVRSALPLPQTAHAAKALLTWRIKQTLRARDRRLTRWLRPVLIGCLVFVSGGVLGASIERLLVASLSRPAPSPIPARLPVVKKGGGKAPHVYQMPVALPAASAVTSPPADSPTPAVVPPRRRLTLADPAPALPRSSAVVPPADHGERVLGDAFRTLRVERNAAGALAALDEYARLFPTGELAPEAATLRTETLLVLGRKQEALHELDRLLAAPTPRSDEHRVLRGELRTALGRWRDALADFDAVLSAKRPGSGNDVPEPVVGRALWGRSVAHSRLGDDDAARADLGEYLRRFPHGPFAAEAARAVGQGP